MKKKDIINNLSSIIFCGDNKTIIDNHILKDVNVFDNKIVVYLYLDNKYLDKYKKKLEKDILKILKKKCNIKKLINIKYINNFDKRRSSLINVNNIFAIASGKGGVGKSTMAVNISLQLVKMGFKVGILDADVYGPSIPIMLNIDRKKVDFININGEKKILPINNYGLKILSLGLFIKPNEAVVWRGPMISKALKQLIYDSYWGDLDFLVIDLPPGTGDVQISIVQQLSINGVVIISTPQKISLSDVKKSVSMFRMNLINVPILGIIENMTYPLKKDYSKENVFFVKKNIIKNFANKYKIFYMGNIPLNENIGEGSDIGIPIVINDNNEKIVKIFEKITNKIVEQIIIRNKKLPPTEIVRINNMIGCLNK